MERYYCNCLNIIINVNSKETRESVGKDLVHLFGGLQNEVQDKNIDPFFAGKLLDVRLAISGIELSQPALSKDRCFGDWLVFTCLNCGLDTHAVHAAKGVDRVLLSVHILHGVIEFNAIKDSSSYSSFLQMKFIDVDDRFKNQMCHLTQSTMMEATEKINESCRRLIQSEEDAKDERIRVFTENESHSFREYRIKAHRDKDSLLRIIRDCDNSTTILDPFGGSLYNSDNLETEEHVPELPIFNKVVPVLMVPGRRKDSPGRTSGLITQSVPSKRGQNLSASIKNHNNQKKSGRDILEKRIFSDNDDILFDMEGYQNEKECVPFFESDDESDGEGTSLEGSGGFSGVSGGISVSGASGASATATRTIPLSPGGTHQLRPLKYNDKIYATSLPVPVPLFNNLRESYDPESDEELKTSPSLSKLAISFKQVARSMQDSTGMFGDLPPRRKERSTDVLSVCDESKDSSF